MKQQPKQLPPLVDDVLFGLDHDLFEDPVGVSLLEIWHAGVADERITQMIQQRAHKERMRQAFSRVPFRTPKLSAGEIVLGLGLEQEKVIVPVQYLNAHALHVAGSGAGKTTRARFFALQVAPHVAGMWLVDLRKKEFRVLRPCLAKMGINLTIVPGQAMRLNPLQVPLGVEPAAWAVRAADMLVQILDLPPGASKIVQIQIFRLYEQSGVLTGAPLFPTLQDLLKAIESSREGHAQARLSVVASLQPVLLRLRDVLNWQVGWTTDELAQRHLVIELNGLGETDKNLILNYLVTAEFASRIARGVSNPRMDLWICCDEAQRLCSASAAGSHVSAIGDLIGLVRGTGIGLDLSVLSMSDLAPQVISNTATKVLGRCGSAGDYAAAGHAIGLTAEQIRWAQLNLSPGTFIGQVGEGTFRHPFVFRVPPMRFEP